MTLALQKAQGKWAKNVANNEWIVVDEHDNEIDRLPKCLKDIDVMQVIHFGRKFEKIAYEEGLSKGTSVVREEKDVILKPLKEKCEQLELENSRLANLIDKFTKEGL